MTPRATMLMSGLGIRVETCGCEVHIVLHAADPASALHEARTIVAELEAGRLVLTLERDPVGPRGRVN
jgi:hypothetical protein